MKKNYTIIILCAFILIISSTSVYALSLSKEIKTSEKIDTEPLLQNGIFIAKIGIEKNKEPIYYLNGNYIKEDKILTCDGTVISGEQLGAFTGIFKEDEKSYFEIKITFEEKTIDFKGTYKFEKNKEDFIGELCNNGKEKCFEFVYPISYRMPDDSIITGNSEKEIYQLIKEWYVAHPNEKEKPVLQYPVDIKYKDGAIATINNDEEMKNAYEKCDDYKEWGWITGTFDGIKDDNRAKNIPNITSRYPLLAKIQKMPIIQRIIRFVLNA